MRSAVFLLMLTPATLITSLGPAADAKVLRAAGHMREVSSVTLSADGKHLVGAAFDGYHGGLAQHNAAVFDINESVGGAEVDADVTGDEAEKFAEHALEWGA